MSNKLIALDAGHGLYTSGKRCLKSIDPAETREWSLNSRIAGYVEEMLGAYDCRVMRVDDITGVTDVDLGPRVQRANSAKADLFVSIHHNAGINGGSGGGIVIYTATAASPVSGILQKTVYDEMIARTGLKGNRSQPIQAYNWYVVKNTSMPAILIECGFMDSTTDTPIILTDDYAQKAAQGIVDGLVKVAGLNRVSGDIANEVDPPPAADEASSWAEEPRRWAVGSGISDGSRPHDTVTREELWTMLWRRDHPDEI